jgi:hypothetical protein
VCVSQNKQKKTIKCPLIGSKKITALLACLDKRQQQQPSSGAAATTTTTTTTGSGKSTAAAAASAGKVAFLPHRFFLFLITKNF